MGEVRLTFHCHPSSSSRSPFKVRPGPGKLPPGPLAHPSEPVRQPTVHGKLGPGIEQKKHVQTNISLADYGR